MLPRSGDELPSESDLRALADRLEELDRSLPTGERVILRAIVESAAPPLDRIRRRGVEGLLSEEERALLDDLEATQPENAESPGVGR